MKTYNKTQDLKNRLKLGFILCLIGGLAMWLTSCSSWNKMVDRQNEMMKDYKREQAYLKYHGDPTRLQHMKEQQVVEARKIKIQNRRRKNVVLAND